jgi:anti-sigma regulatory factor (Ser/Thr protein kinase)
LLTVVGPVELKCEMRFQALIWGVNEPGLAQQRARRRGERVSLNRPAEALAPGPQGAAEARRWVADACLQIGRADLRENAELAMSEVVTNAILHGKDPVTVRLRGTRDHPRVEVRDASPDPLALADDDPTQEFMDELPTFGRGLAIVASFCEAWGAERDGDGKLVWFVPSASPPAHPAEGVVLGWEDESEEPSFAGEETITVHLRDVPVELMQGTMSHGSELRRELRLLAVAHQDTYPVASDLSAYFSALARDFRWQFGGDSMVEAIQRGDPYTDIDVVAPLDAADRFGRLMELYDLADAFCRNERLLTLARSPEQVEFQTWLFSEFVRQGRGGDPVPWTESHDATLTRAHP